MPSSHPRPFVAAMLAALLAVPARAGAQSSAVCSEADPLARVAGPAGFSTQDLDRVARGEVVVRQLPAPDRNEVALAGIVRVAAPRDAIAARAVARFTYRSRDGRRAGGRFSTPPSVDDVRDLTIDPSDLDALRACRPGDCNVKLPASGIRLFLWSVEWSAPHPELAAASIARARIVDYVARYRRAGDAALVVYDDQATPTPAAAAAQSLLGESPILRDEAPVLADFLRRYPAEPPAGVRECIEWSVDQLPGLRPITSVTQIVAYVPANADPAFVVGKQLYASHYFDAALDVRIIMSDPEHPGASVYVVLRRLRFDHLPSGGLLNTRGRVIGRLRGGLGDELAAMRDWGAGGGR
ncbi:MAG TPA: hypothetical protein VHB25_01020 [Gemmatimonadaceae bacterium]|nr:hypothetical protein [Gemmatimonadaceae bacterium]